MKKILLKVIQRVKGIGLALLFLFVGMPIMAIAGRQQMKQVEKELAEKKANQDKRK